MTQYKRRKFVTQKEVLDTVGITLEHLEDIFLCFTGQGSQQLSFCQSVLETYQQQFSAGVEYALTSARCLSFVHPKPKSSCKTLHTLIKRITYSFYWLSCISMSHRQDCTTKGTTGKKCKKFSTLIILTYFSKHACPYYILLQLTNSWSSFYQCSVMHPSCVVQKPVLSHVGQKCYQDTSTAAK